MSEIKITSLLIPPPLYHEYCGIRWNVVLNPILPAPWNLPRTGIVVCTDADPAPQRGKTRWVVYLYRNGKQLGLPRVFNMEHHSVDNWFIFLDTAMIWMEEDRTMDSLSPSTLPWRFRGLDV